MKTTLPYFESLGWNATGNSTYEPTISKPYSPGVFKEVTGCLIMMIILLAKPKLVYFHMSSIVITLVALAILLMVAPLVLFLFLCLTVYRESVRLLVLRKLTSDGSQVVDLMQGSDVFWAMSENTNRPVINVLAFMELHSAATDPLQVAKETFKKLLISHSSQYWKLFCTRRYTNLGFFYWERRKVNISEHVRWMDFSGETMKELNEYLSKVVCYPLPGDDLTCWEVLISKNRINGRHPILFRIHHSVGDGISLINLLNQNDTSRILPPLHRRQRSMSSGPEEAVVAMSRRRYAALNYLESLKKFFHKLVILSSAPWCLVRQSKVGHDRNHLYGPELSGEKHLIHAIERDEDVRVMSKIKKIRDKTSSTFTDVLFCAVSEALEIHFQTNIRNEKGCPKDISVVLPTRLPNAFERAMILTSHIGNTKLTKIIPKDPESLGNNYSLGLIRLPIASKKKGLLKKLDRIKCRTAELRQSNQLVVNYHLLNFFFTLLPVQLLRYITKVQNFTLVLSNVPGPVVPSSLGNWTLRDAVFWVPQKEKTGLGISLLSYEGKLNFGLVADNGVVKLRDEAQLILDNVLRTIDQMYLLCCHN